MLYLSFKFMHVLATVIWVGGVAVLSLLNFQLARSKMDAAGLQVMADIARRLNMTLLMPAAILTLLTGVGATVSGGLRFGNFWISLGFLGIILSVALGATLIRQTTAKLSKLAAEGEMSALAPVQRRLAGLNLINLLVLAAAIGVMVYKPTL